MDYSDAATIVRDGTPNPRRGRAIAGCGARFAAGLTTQGLIAIVVLSGVVVFGAVYTSGWVGRQAADKPIKPVDHAQRVAPDRPNRPLADPDADNAPKRIRGTIDRRQVQKTIEAWEKEGWAGEIMCSSSITLDLLTGQVRPQSVDFHSEIYQGGKVIERFEQKITFIDPAPRTWDRARPRGRTRYVKVLYGANKDVLGRWEGEGGWALRDGENDTYELHADMGHMVKYPFTMKN